MTFALDLCTGHHVEWGLSAWLGSTLCLVFDGELSKIRQRPN